MLTTPLQPRRALGRGLALLRQQPLPLLGFSAAAWGLHGLGWALVAAGDRLPSAVLGALLRGVGIVLYGGGLLWLVEGLSRAGLALAAGQRPHWRELYRWHGRSSRRLAWGLLNLVAALAFTALVGFVGWSLVVFLLPALSPLPALLAVLGCGAVGLSQVFNACLVLERQLSPSQAFRQGFVLLEHHWAGLLQLVALLALVSSVPTLLLGFVAEALVAGLGVPVTVVAVVAASPLVAVSTTCAYRQLLPELAPDAPAGLNRSDR
jgi:hypothetical protein